MWWIKCAHHWEDDVSSSRSRSSQYISTPPPLSSLTHIAFIDSFLGVWLLRNGMLIVNKNVKCNRQDMCFEWFACLKQRRILQTCNRRDKEKKTMVLTPIQCTRRKLSEPFLRIKLLEKFASSFAENCLRGFFLGSLPKTNFTNFQLETVDDSTYFFFLVTHLIL